ncbi:hypothetical protein H2200_000758 [Cladophialophora chaetospira]|uniref:Uncharacterized protein n=1 Tax=Cladophialophora chaetospira TaxID=386627 RepID=A0AA39CQM7_9EURO|nr:hypothetical protein H2200_000758 [Cladophialophora chaetospira]
MPPMLPAAHDGLQKRIVIIPHDGQKPTIWLFVIVLGGITGFAVLAALVGCLAAKCWRKKRNQKIIEKKVADDIEQAQRRQNLSSSTVADEQNDIVERRTANLMAIDAFAGREQKLYANHKKAKLNRSWKTSSVALPVTMAEMKKLPVRTMSSCGGTRPERQPDEPPEMTDVGTSRPSQDLTTAVQVPLPLHHISDTSIDYQEPAALVEDIRSNDRRPPQGKQRRAQSSTAR